MIRRIACASLLAVMSGIGPLSAGTYPTTFSWSGGTAVDQQVQGPCHVFAAAALIESMHMALYDKPADVSEMHFYSLCAKASPISTTIEDALAFAQATGVVNEDCLPYTAGSACNTSAPIASSCNESTSGFFADRVAAAQVPDCGTPWCGCNGRLPELRYRVGAYSALAIATLTPAGADPAADATALKKVLLNRGPIALWMQDTSLHQCGGAALPHAYLVYGWNQAGWLVRDSWPGAGAFGSALTSTSVDIVSLFKGNSGFDAWVLDRTASKPAVYDQGYANGVWSDKAQDFACPDGSAAFSITGPASVGSTPTTYTVANSDLLYDPSLIEWSTEATPQSPLGVVSISPATGATVSAQMQSAGYVTLVAKVKRANGICQVVKKPVQVTNCVIPTFSQFPVAPANVDTCPGRSFQVSTSGTGFLEYRWVLSTGLTLDGWNGTTAATSSSIWVRVQPGFTSGVVRLYVRNVCGWSTDDNRAYVRKQTSPPCN
jgi:hypothetical protein